MRFSRPLAACAAAAVILTLSACAEAPSDSDESVETPLTPYWEALYGGGADMDEQMKEQQEVEAKIQKKVAECMTEQGFEYTAFVPDFQNDTDMSGSDDDVWDPDDEKWVAKWGYGITDWPGREDEDQEQEQYEEEASDDPNYAYYESLTDGEKAAYDETLSGPVLTDEEYADPDYEYKWEEGGCYGKASHEVEVESENDVEEADLSKYEDLITRMDSLWEEQLKDPKIVALEGEWSTCMSEAGEAGFNTQYDAAESINTEYQELNPTIVDPGPEETAVEGEAAEELEVSPETDPELAALKKREIDLALTDLECREKTSYGDRYQKLSIDFEQQFVDENKAELDAMKLALEQVG